MSKTVLFSPIGETDPIKNGRDGSMLHICRVYKPDVVYLYLSKEMLEHSKEDDRYRFAIEKLGQLLNHHFEVHTIERSDLNTPHEYNYFYEDFRNIIIYIENNIMKEGDELILNMASGTPAMKSALMVMAALEEYRYHVIQVESPLHMSNHRSVNYDVRSKWEENKDNLEEYKNRCFEEKSLNLTRLLNVKTIIKHIGAYDYPAALSIAKELKPELDSLILKKIEAANERIKLNWTGMVNLIGKDKTNEWSPVEEQNGENDQKLFEYALVLKIKVKKEEYADFLRGITPLVTDLFELLLKRCTPIDINDYCKKRERDGVRVWDKTKLKPSENNKNQEARKVLEVLDEWYEKKEKGKFKPGQPVYAGSMEPLIIEFCGKDQELVKKVMEISNVAGAVRNMAAHQIVSVTNDWFIENTKKNAEEIMDLLKYLVEKSGILVSEGAWDSYDLMNEQIISQLKNELPDKWTIL